VSGDIASSSAPRFRLVFDPTALDEYDEPPVGGIDLATAVAGFKVDDDDDEDDAA
jgi:hypothetical protein